MTNEIIRALIGGGAIFIAMISFWIGWRIMRTKTTYGPIENIDSHFYHMPYVDNHNKWHVIARPTSQAVKDRWSV